MAEPNATQTNIRPERDLGGELIPTGGIVAGSIIGSRFGTPGRVVGAGAGGVVGETIQQTIEKVTGERPSYDFGQIAATGVTAAGLEATVPAVLRAGKKAISPAVEVLRPKMAKVMGALSGYAEDIVTKALERGAEVSKAVKIGEKSLNDIIIRSVGKINALARESVKQTKNALNQLSRRFSLGGVTGKMGGITGEFDRKLLKPNIDQFINKTIKVLREIHNVGVKKGTELLFERPIAPGSRILVSGDQKTIQKAFEKIISIRNNSSITKIDSVLEDLIVLKSRTPVGSPTGSETKAILNEMMDGVLGFVDNLYPEYSQFLKGNLPKRILIKEAQELLGSNARPSPLEVSKIAGRLFQLYNTGRLAVREGIEKVGKEIGEDITGAVAGAIMKIDDSFSFRAKQLGARGALEKLVEAIPRASLDAYVRTGRLTGDLLNSKAAQLISKAIGISRKASGHLIGQVLLVKD